MINIHQSRVSYLCPAGKIATMALREITDLGKEEYSKPANTVFHNTDADDIVDSAKSVTQAKELSRVIDALLKVGSFFLKGCL